MLETESFVKSVFSTLRIKSLVLATAGFCRGPLALSDPSRGHFSGNTHKEKRGWDEKRSQKETSSQSHSFSDTHWDPREISSPIFFCEQHMNTYTTNLPLFLKDSTISALLHRGKTPPEQYPIEGESSMKMAAGPEDCLLSFTWHPWYSGEVVCCGSDVLPSALEPSSQIWLFFFFPLSTYLYCVCSWKFWKLR